MVTSQQIIGPEQSGFLNGRHLNNSVRRVINIINFSKKVNAPRVTISMDAEKAFEQVAWGWGGGETKDGFYCYTMD